MALFLLVFNSVNTIVVIQFFSAQQAQKSREPELQVMTLRISDSVFL